jgi:organic radical activating enzyme
MKIRPRDLWNAWGRLLRGSTPLLSIEVTRDCPLRCPGCYARTETHSARNNHQARETRGDDLVAAILRIVRRHDPLHLSLVGGEPLLRRRELDILLPQLSQSGIVTMVVTSGVIPIPPAWQSIPRVVVCVSVDGLPAEHDRRRAPATYERILSNIDGRSVNIHWTVVSDCARQPGYIEEYVGFWSAKPEVRHILMSIYTPQRGEHSPQMLTLEDRRRLAASIPGLRSRYPKLLVFDGMARAFLDPPHAPASCLFARMSRAYSSDLTTCLEPCVIGGDPDCLQCGCSIAIALHAIAAHRIAGPMRVGHIIAVTTAAAAAVNAVRGPKERNAEAGPRPTREERDGVASCR